MKIRQGFVSNSSSTSYYITNHSDENKDLVDFVMENPQIIEDYIHEYVDLDWNQPEYKNEELEIFTQENLLKSAELNNFKFKPGKTYTLAFGDEDSTVIGNVFDYVLRDGGSSKSFRWKFHEYLR